jgi:molybdopterin synthase catalytic subunit
MVHRIGHLEIGEASVAIAVSAPHRHQALAACAYAIDRLKETVPIWKKEVWTDGEEWVGPAVCHDEVSGSEFRVSS